MINIVNIDIKRVIKSFDNITVAAMAFGKAIRRSIDANEYYEECIRKYGKEHVDKSKALSECTLNTFSYYVERDRESLNKKYEEITL